MTKHPKLYIPRPTARPGEDPDFSYLDLSKAGAVDRPPIDAKSADIENLALEMVRVLDDDLNVNPGAAEQVTITVSSTSYPAGVQVVCTEIMDDIGIFEGTVQLYSAGGSGDLMVAHGDTVTAYYHDDDCDGDPLDVEESTAVDCEGPVTSNVNGLSS